jgi:hypothetical protein
MLGGASGVFALEGGRTLDYNNFDPYGGVAELVDAHDLGSCLL